MLVYNDWEVLILKAIILFLTVLFCCSANAQLRAAIEKSKYSESVKQQAYGMQFDDLDTEASALLQSKETMLDGLSKLHQLYEATYYAALDLTAGESWDRSSPRIIGYERSHPNSKNAALLLSVFYQAKAWTIRGTGFANATSDEQMRGFKEYMLKAREVLDGRRDQLNTNPEWYSKRIILALYTNESRAKIQELFHEGATKFPHYDAIFFNRAISLMPKWGGSLKDMETFINDSAQYGTNLIGHPWPVRTFWFLSEQYEQLWESNSIQWNLVNTAIRDVLKVYPTDWNSQYFLYLSCRLGDKQVAASVVPYIKEQPSTELLGPNVTLLQSCTKWAKGDYKFLLRSQKGMVVRE